MSTTSEYPELFSALQDDHQRQALIADCLAAGHTGADAARLADRLIATMPGLATAPNSKTRDADAARCRARNGADMPPAPLLIRESPVRADRFYAGARRAPNSGAPLFDSHKPTGEAEP
jgi:hypothetical protein